MEGIPTRAGLGIIEKSDQHLEGLGRRGIDAHQGSKGLATLPGRGALESRNDRRKGVACLPGESLEPAQGLEPHAESGIGE